MDMTGEVCDINIRTDANNLVTTSATTHLPEQKETIHMITMLRTEVLSGSIHDLAHVVTGDMLADPLTKASVKPDTLIKAVNTGRLPNADKQPSFRTLMRDRHKAFYVLAGWVVSNIKLPHTVTEFLGCNIERAITLCCSTPGDKS